MEWKPCRAITCYTSLRTNVLEVHAHENRYRQSASPLRQGTDPLLEEMSMAHYSIFYHLGRVHELFVSLEQEEVLARQHYDDIFFHMSAATEMVDRFLFALWKIHGTVQGQVVPGPLSLHDVVEKAKGFHRKEYQKSYERYLETGRSVSIPLHNVREQLKTLLKSLGHAEELAKEVWQIADRIRSYRNVLTHNPLIPQLIDPRRGTYLPKQDKLSKYKLWSSAFYDKKAHLDFEPASEIAKSYLHEFESRVNELWQEFIEALRNWSETGQYKGMLPPEPEGPTVAIEQDQGVMSPGEAPQSWPSGTASVPGLLDADDGSVQRES